MGSLPTIFLLKDRGKFMANNEKNRSVDGRAVAVMGNFLSGDRKWGVLRLFFLGAVAFILFIASFFLHGFGRYLIAPFFAVLLAFMAGVRYIQDIYELENFWQAFRYLFASFFGVSYPRLSVYGGKKRLKDGEMNLLDVIGGPGFVFVQPGNAVLFEGQNGPAAIHSSGRHFVPRFETIQPIALEDQYGELEGISAMTRDGFDVKISRTRFRFRLLADRQARSRQNPYPYSEGAIYDMVYNRTVSDQGLGDWSFGVASDIRRALTGYINRHTLDDLTAPQETGGDPRGDMQRELRSRTVVNGLRQHGTELLWIDIGGFEIPNKQVEQQRLNTWQAKWLGDARLARSYGEAKHLAYQEIGRAEAQAEMLISIMHALSDVNLRGGTRQSLRDMILVRTAQLLDAMSESIPIVVEPSSWPSKREKGSIMIALEDVYAWLNKFEQSHISPTSSYLITQMKMALAEGRADETKGLLQQLKEHAYKLRDDEEVTAVLLECAHGFYMLDGFKEAETVLVDAVSRAWADLHRRAVIQWMLGCVQWQTFPSRQQAVISWRNSLSDFERLTSQPGITFEEHAWYQETSGKLEQSLLEALEQVGSYMDMDDEHSSGTSQKEFPVKLKTTLQHRCLLSAQGPNPLPQCPTHPILSSFSQFLKKYLPGTLDRVELILFRSALLNWTVYPLMVTLIVSTVHEDARL